MSQEFVKENPWDKIVSFFNPRAGLKRQMARIQAATLKESFQNRSYEGASMGSRMSSWRTPSTSVNTEIKTSNLLIRDRARDLVRNNPHANRALGLLVANVVGTGIQGTPGCPNKEKQRLIKELWDEHSSNPEAIDADKRHDFSGLQSLVFRTVVESGECLVSAVPNSKTKNPFSFRIMEPDHIDSYREYRVVESGGFILQGIEHDKNGSRVAYWLFKEHPGGFGSLTGFNPVSERVSAENIIHVFRCDRPGQVRGVSWFAPVIVFFKDFGDYIDSQLVKQKISSCYSVLVQTTGMDGMDDYNRKKPKTEQEKLNSISPGTVQYLTPGEDVKFVNPPSVDGFSDFTGEYLRYIAAGMGVTYEALTGDLRGCNFSSGRMGFIEFQRNIDYWRWHMLIPQFCDPVWKKFKQGLEINGIDTSDVTIKWVPPRRELIDVSKELEGIKTAIRSGLVSLSGAISEFGFDPEEHLKEVKDDFERLDALGLLLDCDPRKDSAKISNPTKDEDSEVQENAKIYDYSNKKRT